MWKVVKVDIFILHISTTHDTKNECKPELCIEYQRHNSLFLPSIYNSNNFKLKHTNAVSFWLYGPFNPKKLKGYHCVKNLNPVQAELSH